MGEGIERRPASLVYSAVLPWPGTGSVEHTPSTFTLEQELLEGRAVSYLSSYLPFLPSRGSGVRFMKSCVVRVEEQGLGFWFG